MDNVSSAIYRVVGFIENKRCAVGTAFSVGPRHLISCAHVIGTAGDYSRLAIEVSVQLGRVSQIDWQIHESSEYDIALGILHPSVPDFKHWLSPVFLPLLSDITAPLTCYGYPAAIDNGISRWEDRVSASDHANGWVALQGSVMPGVSGGPVIYNRGAMGVIRARHETGAQKYILPLVSVFSWLEEKGVQVSNPGELKIENPSNSSATNGKNVEKIKKHWQDYKYSSNSANNYFENIYKTYHLGASDEKESVNLSDAYYHQQVSISFEDSLCVLTKRSPEGQDNVGPKKFDVNGIRDFFGLKNILITGDCGQGKSTISRHMAYEDFKNKCYLPIFCELRHLKYLDTTMIESDQILRYELKRQICLWDIVDADTVDDKLLNELLQAELVCIYLDGFDEVPFRFRDGLIKEIELLCHQFIAPIVITSRTNTSLGDLRCLCEVKLPPLELTDIPYMLASFGQGAESVSHIFSAIKKMPVEIKKLLSTPLMIQLFVRYYYRAGDRSPQYVADFLGQIFSLLMFGKARYEAVGATWGRETKSNLSERELEQAFNALCYVTRKQEDYGSFRVKDIYKEMKRANRYIPDIHIDVDLLVKDVKNITNLLVSDGDGYRFIHPVIQYYHSSEFIKDFTVEEKEEFYMGCADYDVYQYWEMELSYLKHIDVKIYNYFLKRYFLGLIIDTLSKDVICVGKIHTLSGRPFDSLKIDDGLALDYVNKVQEKNLIDWRDITLLKSYINNYKNIGFSDNYHKDCVIEAYFEVCVDVLKRIILTENSALQAVCVVMKESLRESINGFKAEFKCQFDTYQEKGAFSQNTFHGVTHNEAAPNNNSDSHIAYKKFTIVLINYLLKALIIELDAICEKNRDQKVVGKTFVNDMFNVAIKCDS